MVLPTGPVWAEVLAETFVVENHAVGAATTGGTNVQVPNVTTPCGLDPYGPANGTNWIPGVDDWLRSSGSRAKGLKIKSMLEQVEAYIPATREVAAHAVHVLVRGSLVLLSG
jgi:hypothetical protein